MKKLYRYEIQYKTFDSDTEVVLKEYQVERETDCTYFIRRYGYEHYTGKLKLVRKNAYNAFAYDSKEEAMQHFKRRTQRRIEWFGYWKEECEKALEIIKG